MKTLIVKTMMELSDDFGNMKEQEVMSNLVDLDFDDEESLKTGIKISNETVLKVLTAAAPDDTVSIISDNLTFTRVHFEESDMNFMIYYQVKE